MHVLSRGSPEGSENIGTNLDIICQPGYLDDSRAKEAEDEVLYLIINVDDLLCPRPSPSRRWMDIAVPVHRKSRDPSSPTAVAIHGWGSFGS